MSEQFRGGITDLYRIYDDLRSHMGTLEQRLVRLEVAAENERMRNTQFPGWVIAIIATAISALSVIWSMWTTGRVP